LQAFQRKQWDVNKDPCIMDIETGKLMYYTLSQSVYELTLS